MRLSSREWSVLAYRLDLLRALGLRHALRQVQANRRHRRVLPGRLARLTERMWREAAQELGVEVRELAPAVLEFRLGERRTRVVGQRTSLGDPVSIDIASNKPLAHRLLAEAAVPVPQQLVVDVHSVDAAFEQMERWGVPCVVKPARGRGGGGVTGEVRDRAQLQAALNSAARYDRQALLEQQARGDSYRVLLLDGKVLDILRRPPLRIVGDGRSTLGQLMLRQYEQRIRQDGPAGIKPLAVDLDCVFTLAGGGRAVSSIPAAGTAVTIRTATNYNGPGETETVPPPFPDEFVQLARRAADALQVRLAGVDLVANNHQQAIVLEVNPVPGLNHHYNVSNPGLAVRVALPILAALLESDGQIRPGTST